MAEYRLLSPDRKAVNGGAKGRKPPCTQLSLDEADNSSELVSDKEHPVETNGTTHADGDITDHEEFSEDSDSEAHTLPATTAPK